MTDSIRRSVGFLIEPRNLDFHSVNPWPQSIKTGREMIEPVKMRGLPRVCKTQQPLRLP
jgi:hypothetical protein